MDLEKRGRDFSRRFSPDTLTVPRMRKGMKDFGIRMFTSLLGIDKPKENQISGSYDTEFDGYLRVKGDIARALADDYQGFTINRTYGDIELDRREVYAKNEGNRITIPADMSREREDYVLAHETGEAYKMWREGKTRLDFDDHVKYEGQVLTALYELSMEGNERAGEAYREAIGIHKKREISRDVDERMFSERSLEAHNNFLNRLRSYWN